MKKYMVTERILPGCFDQVYLRYDAAGRMLPDGLAYLDSWASEEKLICYQLMQTSNPDLFLIWIKHWSDLVEFEIVEIDPPRT